MKKHKKAKIDQEWCVGCGVGMNECPLKVITINEGIYADVDEEKCVGCGKCERVCPASIITIEEGDNYEKQ